MKHEQVKPKWKIKKYKNKETDEYNMKYDKWKWNIADLKKKQCKVKHETWNNFCKHNKWRNMKHETRTMKNTTGKQGKEHETWKMRNGKLNTKNNKCLTIKNAAWNMKKEKIKNPTNWRNMKMKHAKWKTQMQTKETQNEKWNMINEKWNIAELFKH